MATIQPPGPIAGHVFGLPLSTAIPPTDAVIPVGNSRYVSSSTESSPLSGLAQGLEAVARGEDIPMKALPFLAMIRKYTAEVIAHGSNDERLMAAYIIGNICKHAALMPKNRKAIYAHFVKVCESLPPEDSRTARILLQSIATFEEAQLLPETADPYDALYSKLDECRPLVISGEDRELVTNLMELERRRIPTHTMVHPADPNLQNVMTLSLLLRRAHIQLAETNIDDLRLLFIGAINFLYQDDQLKLTQYDYIQLIEDICEIVGADMAATFTVDMVESLFVAVTEEIDKVLDPSSESPAIHRLFECADLLISLKSYVEESDIPSTTREHLHALAVKAYEKMRHITTEGLFAVETVNALMETQLASLQMAFTGLVALTEYAHFVTHEDLFDLAAEASLLCYEGQDSAIQIEQLKAALQSLYPQIDMEASQVELPLMDTTETEEDFLTASEKLGEILRPYDIAARLAKYSPDDISYNHLRSLYSTSLRWLDALRTLFTRSHAHLIRHPDLSSWKTLQRVSSTSGVH